MQSNDEGTASSGLAASARGWHRIQLAVLGFIGFCGALWAGGEPSGPAGVQWLAGALVLLAIVLACLAIYLVGRVAYPFYGTAAEPEISPTAVAAGMRRLRTGVRLTYLAVIALVLATLSGWWPSSAGAEVVQVRNAAGQVWCGEIVEAQAGAIGLKTADGQVAVPLRSVTLLRPVGGC